MPLWFPRPPRTPARRTAGLLGLLLAPALAFAQTGTLAGTVVDAGTGAPLIAANVYVPSLERGAATDLDGRFRLAALPVGTYTVRVSYTGYAVQSVTGVEVADGAVVTLDLGLTYETFDEVTVTAAAARDNRAALLRVRQRAPAVSDAIGADEIARAGASTASDALRKVTGASVVGGRYVVMRGLQGRYLNVQLNGATIPSSDPDRNAVPLDLFPTGLLDHIVTTKTFTPDRPGDVTGGSVDLATRAFPTSLSGSVSFSTGFETAVSPGSDLLYVPNASLGVFGRPEGELGLPAAAQGDIPALSLSFFDDANAGRLDAASRAFSPTLTPGTRPAPLDRGVAVSVGTQTAVAGRPLGVIAGLTWSRSYDGFSGGATRAFKGLRTADGVALAPTFEATSATGGGTSAGSERVLYGGLANLSYALSPLSRVGLHLMANRSAEVEAFTEAGRYADGTLDEEAVRQARSLLYQDRSLVSAQLTGEHALAPDGLRVDWKAALAHAAQDEPDYRVFFNDVLDGTYGIDRAAYSSPTRFFRDLTEATATASIDVTAPMAWLGAGGQLKAGALAQARERAFRERTFQLLADAATFNGDPDAYAQGAGLVGRDGARNVFGTYIADASSPLASYDGAQRVAAGYAMATAQLSPALRAIGGVRVEATAMSVDPTDIANPALAGELLTVDVLPSLNLVYALSERANLRAAYGRTLARPSFRELAPYASYELRTNRTFLGNPGLRRALVDNADLRAEWFARPGEVVAVSAYYKRFAGPIELTYNVQAVNAEVQPRNLADASVYGVELEARRGLGFLPGALRHLQAGGNLTLAYSAVEVTEAERERRLSDEATRPLQGQSPFMLNLDVSYEAPSGTSAGLFYNLFGSRLNAVSVGLTPDIYEQARGMLDLTLRQPLVGDVAVTLSAKNLLGASYRLVQSLDGQAFVTEAYPLGRAVSMSVSYGF